VSLFAIRAAERKDHAFIGSHWTRAQSELEAAHGLPSLSRLLGDRFANLMNHSIIDRLLARHDVSTRVAHKPDNADLLYGFSCIGPGAHLHFIFVRPDFRGSGIANALLADKAIESCSVHWPRKGNPAPRLPVRTELSW
jgi:GNAT superfamily N-acetyltransferase